MMKSQHFKPKPPDKKSNKEKTFSLSDKFEEKEKAKILIKAILL